jgi:LysM repeat protein
MQARSTGEPELLQAQRRRRDAHDAERGGTPRRARRRRQSAPWLQRNALGVAAISILIAFLGLGFGLLQMLSRPEVSSAALSQNDLAMQSTNGSVMSAAAVNGSVQGLAAPIVGTVPDPGRRPIQATAKVLQPDYTIASGDTLVKIAQRFNTSVERIQAFNNLSDPRVLRIGAQLIIPAPL